MAHIRVSTANNESSLWLSIQRLFGAEPFTKNSPKGTDLVDTLNLMPLAGRVALAFEKLPPTETEERLIKALILRPGSDTKTLSVACGWSAPIWHTHFGLMCQRRIDWLLPPSQFDQTDAQFIHGVLVDYSASKGLFKMKAEVEEVFREMGLG